MRHSRFRRSAIFVVGLLGSIALGSAGPALAAPNQAVPGCFDPAPARLLAKSTVSPVGDVIGAQVSAAYKASHDPARAEQLAAAASPTEVSINMAKRKQWLATHSLPSGTVNLLNDNTSGQCALQTSPAASGGMTGFVSGLVSKAQATTYSQAYVSYLNQQGQQTWFWCGPSTVSEMATTFANVGRITGPVSQATAASYMGTDSTNGTSAAGLTAGLNNYVGVPVYGWNFFLRVNLDYNPTQAQRDTWLRNLDYDVVTQGTPDASVMWEGFNGPHLVGHPNQAGDIFHIVETGGYSGYGISAYYADSATTVWSGVQPFSWYNMYDFVSIMGGRGYDW